MVKELQKDPKTKCFPPCIDTEIIVLGEKTYEKRENVATGKFEVHIVDTPRFRCVRNIKKTTLDLVGEIIYKTFY